MNPLLPDIQSMRTNTGLELWAAEMHGLPIVSIAIILPSGSANDTPAQAGLSHLAGAALDAGTAASDIHSLAERIEFLGTSLHVSVIHDASSIILSTLSRHLEDAMEIAGEILCTAAYPPQEVERLRQSQIASLAQMRDRPGTRASLSLDRALFGGEHPYGKSTLGTPETVDRLTRDDAYASFITHYRPQGALAIAVGDITIEAWQRLIERHLAGWSGGDTRTRCPAATENTPRRGILLIDRPETPQAEVRMGCIAMPRNHPDFLAASLLNQVLGGQFTSRINTSLREQRGLTYGAWSAFSGLRYSGTFVQGGAFHTERTDEAVRVLFDEVRRIADGGISDEELAFARQSMAGTFLRSFETSPQVCGRLQAMYAFDLPDNHYATYLQRLAAITGEDVLRVARRWLDTDSFAVVVAGDAGLLRVKLEQMRLGEVLLYEDA